MKPFLIAVYCLVGLIVSAQPSNPGGGGNGGGGASPGDGTLSAFEINDKDHGVVNWAFNSKTNNFELLFNKVYSESQMKIFDESGRLLKSLENFLKGQKRYDISTLSMTGNYYHVVIILDNKYRITKKIMKNTLL